jgi:hypothetical protein
MTLREMIDSIGIDEEPLECSFVMVAFMRTVLQGEPSTFEGDCASLIKTAELVGRPNQPETVRKVLSHLGPIPDMEVPDSIWLSIANADAE